eukprot:UN27188
MNVFIIKNDFCVTWLYNCYHCKALIVAHILDTYYLKVYLNYPVTFHTFN